MKNSNGSKHISHLNNDLQAVELNLLIKVVFSDLHWGQITVSEGGEIKLVIKPTGPDLLGISGNKSNSKPKLLLVY